MAKSRIGYKKKGKMQGTYVKKKPTANPTRKRQSIPQSTNCDIPPPLSPETPNLRSKKNSLASRSISMRISAYYHYIYVLDAPHKEHWAGVDGTISLIRKALHLRISQSRMIERVLNEIVRCMTIGVEFDGTYLSEHNRGRKVSIKPGSPEETLIATWMEAHCGFRMTTILVNEHRRQQGMERVSRYAVMSAFYRLKPVIRIIQKEQSGGNNEEWKQASYNICKQMQIMRGELTDEEIMTDRDGKSI